MNDDAFAIYISLSPPPPFLSFLLQPPPIGGRGGTMNETEGLLEQFSETQTKQFDTRMTDT